MKIISGSANIPLANHIAKHLGISLSPVEIFIFPDGERRIWLEDVVVEEDCIVVQPTSTPVDEHYMELFFLIDSLRRSGARSVTVVMPYMGYQRQDHIFRSGEAVSIDVVITMLESLKVDRVIAYDLHTIKIPEEFRIPLTHLSALGPFAKKIKDKNWQDDTMLVSPDMGGVRRIKELSELLDGMPYAMTVKDRDLASGNISTDTILDASENPVSHVAKRVLIVDDMASSGKTLVAAAELLKRHGAEEIYAFATHAVFSKEAPKLLQESIIKKVFVTDTVLVPEEKQFEKLEIVSVAGEIAHALKEN